MACVMYTTVSDTKPIRRMSVIVAAIVVSLSVTGQLVNQWSSSWSILPTIDLSNVHEILFIS